MTIQPCFERPYFDHQKPPGVDPRKIFLKHRERDGGAECWPWDGAISVEGYGRISHDYVHRLSWMLYNRRFIPEGFQVDHVCHNEALGRGECQNKADSNDCLHRRCWNPDHLRAVPEQDNKSSAKKTHCIRGHVLAGANLIPNRSTRQCVVCADMRDGERGRKTASESYLGGDNHPNVKIRDADLSWILENHRGGHGGNTQEIADKFGVYPQTISRLVRELRRNGK